MICAAVRMSSHVLGRERRRGQPAALPVDALVVGQHAAVAHDGVDFRACAPPTRRARSGRHRAAARRPAARRAAAPCSRGRRARRRPARSSASRMNFSPFASVTLPSLNLPTRIFGPCRSHMIADRAARSCARSRSPASARVRWSSAVPCEKFMRTTSTPARHALERLPDRSRRGRGSRRSWCCGASVAE